MFSNRTPIMPVLVGVRQCFDSLLSSSSPVLLIGEMGSGKTLALEQVSKWAREERAAFVRVLNCRKYIGEWET